MLGGSRFGPPRLGEMAGHGKEERTLCSRENAEIDSSIFGITLLHQIPTNHITVEVSGQWTLSVRQGWLTCTGP